MEKTWGDRDPSHVIECKGFCQFCAGDARVLIKAARDRRLAGSNLAASDAAYALPAAGSQRPTCEAWRGELLNATLLGNLLPAADPAPNAGGCDLVLIASRTDASDQQTEPEYHLWRPGADHR